MLRHGPCRHRYTLRTPELSHHSLGQQDLPLPLTTDPHRRLHPPDHFGKAFDEVAVVHYCQHGAAELVERLLKLGAAGNIEVVDRLIQQQHVALVGDKRASTSRAH